MTVRVLRLRIKDRHAKWLSERAREVNMVWNYCNELSHKVWLRERRFISGFDLQKYLNGASQEGLGIGSAIFQQVAEEYATKRREARKTRLAWRKSGGARRSLGWVPFKARSITYRNGQVRFQGQYFGLWDSYGLTDYELRAGSFSEDARGRWYLNVCVDAAFVGPKAPAPIDESVGIDLGLATLATLSNGEKVDPRRFYRDLEPKLAIAQRAGKKARAKAIHAKIANRRRHHLHQLSNRLVREHRAIFVGNVNASGLARTRMAKSVLDAGWSTLRTMLQYKCDGAGVWFEEVDEAFSTQTCSSCGDLPPELPKGIAGLGIREWTCSSCHTTHDRDVNAARNILAAGHGRLVAGIPVLRTGRMSIP